MKCKELFSSVNTRNCLEVMKKVFIYSYNLIDGDAISQDNYSTLRPPEITY